MAENPTLVRPSRVEIGGASSSGLPRDTQGREVRLNPDSFPDAVRLNPDSFPDAVNASSTDFWAQATPRRIRHSAKTRPVLDPATVLGREPVLNQEDLDASRDNGQEPEHPAELIPRVFPELRFVSPRGRKLSLTKSHICRSKAGVPLVWPDVV